MANLQGGGAPQQKGKPQMSHVKMAQKMSCCAYFVKQQDWMIFGFGGKQEKRGDLICPSASCRQKVGVYSLEDIQPDGTDAGGLKCTCDAVVSPGFLIFKSKTTTTV